MVKYKISITGKANSGKNTLGKLIVKELHASTNDPLSVGKRYQFMAFADPIKEMLRIAYPTLPRKFLYGSSKFRQQPIPNAFKNGQPLTIRQALIDLGNEFGRAYNSEVWLSNFDNRYNKYVKNKEVIILTDCRRINEYFHLKDKGFFHIKLIRQQKLKIDDISETDQDGIQDNDFNYIIHNDGTKNELKEKVTELVKEIKAHKSV